MTKSPDIDSTALEPDIDIDLEAQTRILELAARLDTDDHYVLLGVAYNADKSEIRKAYFDLMNVYHSDKYFGKKIGMFGSVLLRITNVLTRAGDTLGRNRSRAEYDAYLESRRGTLGARLSIVPQAPDSTNPDPLRPQVSSRESGRPAVAPIDIFPQFPRTPGPPTIDLGEDLVEANFGRDEANGAPTELDAARLGPSPSPLDRPSPPPARPSPPPSDAARKLLARKMGKRPKGTASADPQRVREAIRADLKTRYDNKKNEAEEQVQKLLGKSEVARSSGDWSGAVASVRKAAELRPDDPTVQARLVAVQAEADRALAPRFLEQGHYEEREGHFARAARSYERAARGKDSAQLFNKGAECLLHLETLSDSEKRTLVELARNAVTRDHSVAQYRVTLARAYSVAGMKSSALGEVKRALELEPENQQAKSLLKSLK